MQAIKRLFAATTINHKGSKTRRGVRQVKLGSEMLEGRQLMATGPVFDPGTKQLLIYGTSGNDSVSVGYGSKTDSAGMTVTDSSQIKVSMQIPDGSYIEGQFAAADILLARYVGKGGDDLIQNRTNLVITVADQPNGGTISTSLLYGSTNNSLNNQSSQIGVFTVGRTGEVSVDYIFRGAGYNGSLGFYSLEGMDQYTPGSDAYIKEAVRRANANGSQGFTSINAATEAARFSGKTSWEGDLNNKTSPYKGLKTFTNLAPGSTFAAIIIPSGTFSGVNTKLVKNQTLSSSERPLFSIPEANPYVATSQLWGQMGDLDNRGSLFAFEDQRLDGTTDKDYNDMVFQITGATGVAAPVTEVANPSRKFQSETVFQSEIKQYATEQKNLDVMTESQGQKGIWQVAPSGQVTVDYRFDGGGYESEMAIFSLAGMENLTPGSPEYIKEAARRALTGTELGYVVIRDRIEGAAVAGPMTWESNFNKGGYNGIKTFAMKPGDLIGAMMVPAGTIWEAFNKPELGKDVTSSDNKKRALFSIPEANPMNAWGGTQMIDSMYGGVSGRQYGWEDIRGDNAANCDRDFNDIVFSIGGVSMGTIDSWDKVPTPSNKKILNSTLATSIFV
ncbi:DUF4114 domain-containing protein [bacterium]|nr:DUF4114 domain-containing protein [bacterium]